MAESDLERIIVIHPHKEFDRDLKCKGFIDESVDGFLGKDEDILVVQGYKEDEWRNPTDEKSELYLDGNRGYKVITSKTGKIEKDQLNRFIKEGATIRLMGGIVGQCHRNAFESMVEYMQENDIHDVEFIIPFDGCYFQHGWAKRGSNWEKRFDGIFMGGYGYEMEGGNSYTLREVITKKFGQLESPLELHRRQIRDDRSNPVLADQETIRRNLTDYFFIGYFVMPHEQKIVTREYELTIDNDQMKIHIH